METKLKFRPIHFNWVAIHPQPIGIIHFIGGAFLAPSRLSSTATS